MTRRQAGRFRGEAGWMVGVAANNAEVVAKAVERTQRLDYS